MAKGKKPAPSRAVSKPRAGRRADDTGTQDPFVVGVGASAGGLQALQSFFGAIGEPPPAAFVVVQHLSPDFKSFMVELLTKHTRMPVQRAEHNVKVKPGNIHLIPPKYTLTISGGRLQLEKADPRRGLHLPIDQLAEIFALVRTQCGVDFAHYKPATVDRRIERRMSVSQIENLGDYARHLKQSTREVAMLFNEMLIGVTSFFRDREAWDTLEKDVLPGLLKSLPANETVRMWVAGCSTGEEAYSLAMMVAEHMDKRKMHNAVKIFATDISKDSLANAARGHYSPSEVAGVSNIRLEKFFNKEGSGYRVRSRLREMVVFANHNLLNDPPFTKLSLILCRNLLIYLQAPMQQRVLTLFSFAPRDDGALFLGSSESIGDATDRFQPLSTKANLYRNRRVGHALPVLSNPTRMLRAPANASAALQRATSRITAGDVPEIEEINRQIIREFSPACLVIDSRDDILHIIGPAGDFLKMSSGGFTRNLFKLTAHNLANALRSALIRAQQKGDKFTYDNIRYTEGRKTHTVRIHVRPVLDKQGRPTGNRLVFLERQTPQPKSRGSSKALRNDAQNANRITDLERDLSLTRDTLQTTVQDLETSNEEIQAANEELLAANEELQSTNEELQSVNEELHTVNAENQGRIDDLTRLTNDINNLLGTASIGVLLIDDQLRVRRASRSALVILDLTEADVGVPIETVGRILHAHDLSQMADRVVKSGQLEERELERPRGGALAADSMRPLPGRTRPRQRPRTHPHRHHGAPLIGPAHPGASSRHAGSP